jgi:Cellulose binding domain
MNDPADRGPGGRRRHGRAAAAGRGPRSILIRYGRYGVLLLVAGAAALATGTILLASNHDRRLAASDCGLVSCSAALPGSSSASAAPQGSPRGRATAKPSPGSHRAGAAHSTSPSPSPSARPAPARSRSPRPSPSVSPAPSASPTPATVNATVTYAVDQRWPGGFQGHFTIVNNGTAALSGWALTATLPGDQIESVWSASYSVAGNQLTLTAPSDQPAIAPGASQSAFFTASGSTAKPTGCVFNSQTCSG